MMNRNKLEQNFLSLSYFTVAIPATLLSLAWIYFLLSLDHYQAIQKIIGLSVALLVIFNFIKTTLLVLRESSLTHFGEKLIHISGLALAMIGSAGMVWSIHLGLTSGDWEYYGLLGAVATAAQGSISLLMIRNRAAGLV